MLKNLLNHLPLMASLAVFVFVVAFLIGTPRVITLAESRFQIETQNIQLSDTLKEVAGESTQPIIQIESAGIATPSVTAYGVYAFDMDLGDELLSKNSQTRLSMASTTKIMTALVAADYYKAGQILIVPKEALVGGSSMDLIAEEKMTFRSLLYGMMLNSGNDAAYTLAYNYPGGLDNFIAQMNQRAAIMGLKNTHFQNPAGFDNVNHYTSAYDMAQIAKVFTQDPLMAKIVATKSTTVLSIDKSQQHILNNLNKLLGIDGIVGIKTGTTEASGENLVTLVEREGHRILIVVLNSKDRFSETKQIVNWIFSNYSWKVSE